MKKHTYINIAAALILIISSCQDVIDIELNNTAPKLVIEGSINDFDNSCTIKLSKTGDYFNPQGVTILSDADISITGNNAEAVSFETNENGIYIAENFQGVENSSYELKVLSEGEEYTPNVTIPHKVNADSISLMYFPPDPRFDGGFMVNIHFTDPAEYTNYYRYKVYKIGDENAGNGNFSLADDKLTNGNNTMMLYNSEIFQLADTIIFELQTLDKSTYDFYHTISGIAGSSGGPPMANTTPANPENNISNGALGNFSAYTVSRDTAIIMMPF